MVTTDLVITFIEGGGPVLPPTNDRRRKFTIQRSRHCVWWLTCRKLYGRTCSETIINPCSSCVHTHVEYDRRHGTHYFLKQELAPQSTENELIIFYTIRLYQELWFIDDFRLLLIFLISRPWEMFDFFLLFCL